MTDKNAGFWTRKTLQQMSHEEWESLCDGCARCCMVKLEDESDGNICFTQVACNLLDTSSCRCGDYANRLSKVPDCVQVHPNLEEQFQWLPGSCAYRRLHEGRELPAWHPLISKDSNSVHREGISMRRRCISETHIHPETLADHIIEFADED